MYIFCRVCARGMFNVHVLGHTRVARHTRVAGHMRVVGHTRVVGVTVAHGPRGFESQ